MSDDKYYEEIAETNKMMPIADMVYRESHSVCATCVHGWNPPGDVTRIVSDNGNVCIQYGNSIICMDDSTGKCIDFRDGKMVCSRYVEREAKE